MTSPKPERGAMRFQVAAILICVHQHDGRVRCAGIAFTAPAIATEWQLSEPWLHSAACAGPMGMVIGSSALGPLADKHGSNLILTCLVVITAGMLLSGFSQNANQLTAMRLLTASHRWNPAGPEHHRLNTLARWRSFWVSLLQTDIPSVQPQAHHDCG
jgi:hypothetical protein